MLPKRYAECKVDGNEVLCHSDRVLLAMSEYESELASLRAEKERAEAELAEAIRMRDRHAEASKAQNEDITALIAERDAALKDAERYRWLRSNESVYSEDMKAPWPVVWADPEHSNNGTCPCLYDELDAAIDTAIAARKDT